MTETKHRNPLKVTLLSIWVALNVIAAAVTIASAYGGMVDPRRAAWPALLAMVFPVCWVATVLHGVLNLFIKKWVTLIQLGVLIVTVSPFLHVCPLNFFTKSADGAPTISLMSYNVYGYTDDQGIYPDGTNRSVSQIIASGADFVMLQEAGELLETSAKNVPKAQCDSIYSIYPYRLNRYRCQLSIFSRTPLREVRLTQPDSPHAGWIAAETVINGDTILLVSVHLQSIGLDDNDKVTYHEMTEGSKDVHWRSASRTLYDKLARAFRARASQAEELRHQIDSLGYRNVIISGDFNDINLCYAQRVLSEGRMRSAFFEAGCGPTITYHNNRFYFHIDHILYCGDLRAIAFSRGNIKSSDHYPIYATFTVESQRNAQK